VGSHRAERGPGSALVAELLTVEPAPGAHRVAVRAGGCLLVSLVVLASLGHLELALYATFGTFASVYGGRAAVAGRWRVQAGLGVVLTAAVASGAAVGTSPHRLTLVVVVAALWAALAAALSDRFHWRPPGPLFAVFAVASCGSVPTSATGLVRAVAVAAGAAVLAVLLGLLERVLAPAVPAPAPPPWVAHRRVVHVVRCALVVGVAGGLAVAGGLGHASWAMVAAVVPLSAPSLRGQVLRGVHRAGGTLVGVVLAAVLLQLSLPVPAVIAVVVALQAATELLVTRNYGAALVFITPLALVSVQLAAPQPVGALLRDRVVETLIGVAVGLAGAVVTRGRRTDPPPRVTSPT